MERERGEKKRGSDGKLSKETTEERCVIKIERSFRQKREKRACELIEWVRRPFSNEAVEIFSLLADKFRDGTSGNWFDKILWPMILFYVSWRKKPCILEISRRKVFETL